jgi:hypothetical protein
MAKRERGQAMAGLEPDEPVQPIGTGFDPSYLQSAGPPEYLRADDTASLVAAVSGSGRRRRRAWPVVSAVGIAAVIALVAVIAAAGLSSERQNARTAAEVVAAAARQASRVNSESATLTETYGTAGGLTATVQTQRTPALMSMSMRETIDGLSVPISVLLADGTVYMKFGHTSGIPAEMLGKWIKVPLTATGLGSALSGQSGVAGENPASQAALLAGAVDVRATGSQVVNGVPTTIYTGTLSPAAALKNVPASERAELVPGLKQIGGSIDFTVWIDSNSLVRKLAETVTVVGKSVHIVFTVLAYNQPVHVTIPRPSQIYSLPAGSSLAS